MSIRIVLADDHELFLRGLRSLFDPEPDLEVVGDAKNGRAVRNWLTLCSPPSCPTVSVTR